jgi:hypothetical protein
MKVKLNRPMVLSACMALVAALPLGKAMAVQPAIVQAPVPTVLRVVAQPAVPDLQCAAIPRAAASMAPVDMDPREIPDDEDVQAALNAARHVAAPQASADQRGVGLLGQALPGEPYRVAVWGDSHLAAGFFTQELVKILKLEPDQVRPALIPANMNRPGVRLPLRKSCVSPQWRYEPAHAHAAGAAAPGPGLVNLYTSQPDASLAWDLRNAAGVAELLQVRVLYQQTALPVKLAISVDAGPEVEVTLSAAEGPAVLELSGDAPLSVVRVRLVSGDMRLHGLGLPVGPLTALQMDVFGYPGATVAGWKQAQPDYMAAWFAQTRYNLVMMEFGTNEGNVKPFDAKGYELSLRASLKQMRAVFPDAACVLIAPGDRGVLIRRSEKLRNNPSAKVRKNSVRPSAKNSAKKSSAGKAPARQTNFKPSQDSVGGTAKNLLQYTHIHEEIGQIQKTVGQENACKVWSMLNAMGGQGGAYRWVRQSPPLMARDLIHFTVPGYQQLAQQFATDMGWETRQLLPDLKP